MARPESTSLLRRLLAGFMLVMFCIWAAAVAHIAWQVQTDQQHQTAIVNKAWARQIMLGMRSLATQPGAMADTGAAIERLRLDMFREAGFESHARTSVWQHGRLLYDSAPGQELMYPAGPVPAHDQHGWVHWVERDAATGIVVERSEKPNVDWVFTLSGASYMFTPLVYSLPVLLLPAWLIVRHGLHPLRAMAAAVEQRSAADLTPLPASRYRELSPLIEAINRLMQRLSERMAREQEFLADAAHELKTPLSVVQINAHLLENTHEALQRREAALGLREGVARATHTVHQLLALERARPDAAAQLVALDLSALLRDRVAAAAPLAMQRDLEIELQAEQPVTLPLHRESMASLLDNLIGNAIKYSPSGGRITVEVANDDTRGACVIVTDQGPGIPFELRAKVFERFYRVPGQRQAGSGLGLAIAERAATSNGATLRLADNPSGSGLAVTVSFGRFERRRHTQHLPVTREDHHANTDEA
jgi:two-component system sensor histidine kinase QseC